MNKYLYRAIMASAVICSPLFAGAQGMSVNTTGTAADHSAMLDVASTSQGMLVPRMTSSQRGLISLPATGLLVYQVDNTPGFYYNSGTPASPNWVSLNALSNVTTQGNTFNGASQLVQLDGSSKLPAVDGSQLTGLPSTDLTGDVTSTGGVSSYNNVVPANKGGAGAVTGLLKADGSGNVSAATSGTDYLTPTGNGSGLTGIIPTQTGNSGKFLTTNGSSTSWASSGGLANGTSAAQIYLTGSTPFAVQSPQSVTGDITINSSAVTSYNNVVPTNKGGAGAVNGLLSANGAGTVSAASTTGSGTVVLNTSPILVTPNLGTINSGNGAALTGLQNIANNSTAGNSIASALGSATSGTTGAGNVVLATSPTLVTPSLGTPSALVGTNISGTAASLTAGAATVLATARTINGVSFDGSANITVPNFPATISNTITSTTSTYFVTDGSLFTLPAATRSGQVLILLDISPGTGFTGSGFSVTSGSGDSITDNINTGTSGITSLSVQYILRLISDGSHHWYIF